MPFMTDIAYGYPSYDALYSNVTSNFIFANYGGSQGFDTDDGSAWYNMIGNFFYDAMGYKNDYGGFNVNYYENMNVALHEQQYNGWEIEPVNTQGPGNKVYNNKIIVYNCRGTSIYCDNAVGIWPSNLYGALKQYNNSFYTPNSNATIQTWDNNGEIYLSPKEMCSTYNLSCLSTQNSVPSIDEIISWAKILLNINDP